jgi:hypothetical protein
MPERAWDADAKKSCHGPPWLPRQPRRPEEIHTWSPFRRRNLLGMETKRGIRHRCVEPGSERGKLEAIGRSVVAYVRRRTSHSGCHAARTIETRRLFVRTERWGLWLFLASAGTKGLAVRPSFSIPQCRLARCSTPRRPRRRSTRPESESTHSPHSSLASRAWASALLVIRLTGGFRDEKHFTGNAQVPDAPHPEEGTQCCAEQPMERITAK